MQYLLPLIIYDWSELAINFLCAYFAHVAKEAKMQNFECNLVSNVLYILY